MNTLESDLNQLPEPALPEGLTAEITARIARLDEERAVCADDPPRVTIAEASRDRLAWAALLVGVTVSLGAQAYMLLVGDVTLELISPRISGGMDGVIKMLPASQAVAVLVAGLLLHLAGLFALLRGR